MKKVWLIAKILYAMICVIPFIILLAYCHALVNPVLWRPAEGVWYCEELKIQMSFDRSVPTYAEINGKEVICSWGNDRGSAVITISNQDRSCQELKLDEVIFAGEYVELDDHRFVLREYRGETLYTFIRIQ